MLFGLHFGISHLKVDCSYSCSYLKTLIMNNWDSNGGTLILVKSNLSAFFQLSLWVLDDVEERSYSFH